MSESHTVECRCVTEENIICAPSLHALLRDGVRVVFLKSILVNEQKNKGVSSNIIILCSYIQLVYNKFIIFGAMPSVIKILVDKTKIEDN